MIEGTVETESSLGPRSSLAPGAERRGGANEMSDDLGQTYRILIIDDEATIVLALRRYLKSRGFEVESATDLDSAMRLLLQRRFELVIVDLRLGERGDTGGFDIIDFIRERSPDTKSILLTAYGSDSVLAEAHRRGVGAVLRKPLPLADLHQTVLALLG